jgi:hypothetical protein
MLSKKEGIRAPLYAQIICLLSISFLLLYPSSIFFYLQAAAQPLPTTSPNYLLYTNPTYGISIQYPEDWQKLEEGGLSRTNINNTIALAEFHPPDQSVGVVVLVEKLGENMTLDQYVERDIPSPKNYQPNVQLIELNKTTTLTGLPGYRIVYNGSLDYEGLLERFDPSGLIRGMIDFQPVNATSLTFITMQGDNAYIVGYSDLPTGLLNQFCQVLGEQFFPNCPSPTTITNPFLEHLSIAQKMIDSIEIMMPNNTGQTQPNNDIGTTSEDPCSIIDIRFARGDVSIEEYERMREILEC